MEFYSETSRDSELVVASIAEINAGLSTPSSDPLIDLKDSHTREVANIQDRYSRLAEAGYHRGAFQSINSVFLSEDGKSALGQIGLPEGFEHDHDAYYHAHPAVLEAAVVAARDEEGLEKPKAFVVLKDGGEGSEHLRSELKAQVQESVGKWKYPRWIEFLPDLPKTATGKIQRFKLRG